jgi:hypothetical protein
MAGTGEEGIMRNEFTGMLPAAIEQFEKLLAAVPGSKVVKGFSGADGENDLRSWGVVCDISGDVSKLEIEAEKLNILWDGNVSFAYTNGLVIDDFKTYRVGGDLILLPEVIIDKEDI